MDWKELGGKIADMAPGIGSLFGAPGVLIGGGIKVLAKVFGLSEDATPDQINQAIQQDPQSALKLRVAEMDFQLALNKQKLDEQDMYIKDVQSARSREVEITKATGKRDINQYILGWTIVFGFFSLTALLIFHELPKDQNGVVFMLFGALAAGFGTVIGYYFGSSKGSSEKTDLLVKAEAIKQ
jgi:hypothetical protein